MQTRGKSYLVRLSNIEKYAPDYLIRNAAGSERLTDGAVVASVVEDVGDVGKQPLAEYPTALGQTSKRTGLWLHPDDLTPEIGPLAALAPISIAACLSEHVYSEIYQLSRQRSEPTSGSPNQDERRAIATARLLALSHNGVIAWSREANVAVGEYGPPEVLYQAGDVPDLD